jgi:hypothetical protein
MDKQKKSIIPTARFEGVDREGSTTGRLFLTVDGFEFEIPTVTGIKWEINTVHDSVCRVEILVELVDLKVRKEM